MSTLPRISVTDIYNALNPDWWVDTQPSGAGTYYWQQAMIYFQDKNGNYHAYGSTGTAPENSNGSVEPTTRQYYVQALMRDTANWLYNAQCSGGITNIEPKNYQPLPIYFK